MKKTILIALMLLGLGTSASADMDTPYGDKKACDRGIAKECYNLGDMYDLGIDVKKDYTKAVKFYTKACDGGYMSGCYNLGNMYYNGEGVRQSNKNALKYWGKACDGGYASACENYAIVNKK